MPETHIADVKVPLTWEEAVKHQELVKLKAARQFLANWEANRDRRDNDLRWGEEIEYTLVDLSEGKARVALCADEVLRRLGSETGGTDPTCAAGWRTEYGNMMVEGVTHPPFTWSLEEVLKIEPSLGWRRRELERVAAEVRPGVRLVTLSNFPFLGVPGGTSPDVPPAPDGDISKSIFCPDEATSPHPRYQTFTVNYRRRKGCKVAAFIPREGILPEQRLPKERLAHLPFEVARSGSVGPDPVPGYIYVDSQAFGACQCCTQATFLARSLDEARYLTDQFLVLAPLLLALTAATPFLRGLVADTDTRWPTLKQSWDDRREDELTTVRNSRISANDLFIGAQLAADPEAEKTANDVDVPIHEPTLKLLLEGGVEPLLSRHVAHNLVRDALVVFEDRLDIDDAKAADHFEQLQGTNWGTVRFKPPPVGSTIGWRVEFRSPEVQVTDFENAAIVAVVRLLAEVIVDQKWDLLIPISRCDENDETAAERNAAVEGEFWFRESIDDQASPSAPKRPRLAPSAVKRRRLADILGGEGGLFTRCRAWLDGRCREGRCSPEARAKLEAYLQLFELRARGELPTPAAFFRGRLRKHPTYKGDGVLPPDFVHELCRFAAEANGPGRGPGADGRAELLGRLA